MLLIGWTRGGVFIRFSENELIVTPDAARQAAKWLTDAADVVEAAGGSSTDVMDATHVVSLDELRAMDKTRKE